MQEMPAGSLKAVALYEFVSQNQDELTVRETEEVFVLPGECDEEGWLMIMNSAGEKGYVPQNYLEVEGAESAQAIDEVVAASQQQYSVQDNYSNQANLVCTEIICTRILLILNYGCDRCCNKA